MKKHENRSALETSLLAAMKAIDNQIARELQRSPAERDAHGVQKWEPIAKRVELLCSFFLNALGDQETELDSFLVLSQALSKSLLLAIEDLGEDGLGKLRTAYCLKAMENIQSDCGRALDLLRHETALI